MKTFLYHYWTRLTALVRDPVSVTVGTASLVTLFWLGWPTRWGLEPAYFLETVSVRVWAPLVRSVPSVVGELGIDLMLLLIFLRLTACRGRGAGLIGRRAQLVAPPHATLPIGPRSRALAEALVWLPVWYAVVPLCLLALVITVGGPDLVRDVVGEVRQGTMLLGGGTSVAYTAILRPVHAIPLLVAVLLQPRPTAFGLSLRALPFVAAWWMLALIPYPTSPLPHLAVDTLLTGLILVLAPALYAVGQGLALPAQRHGGVRVSARPAYGDPRAQLRWDTWWNGVRIVVFVATPCLLPVVVGIPLWSMVSPSISLSVVIIGWLVGLAACISPLALPLGMRTTACTGQRFAVDFDGTLGRAWSTLPVPVPQVIRNYYCVNLAALGFMVGQAIVLSDLMSALRNPHYVFRWGAWLTEVLYVLGIVLLVGAVSTALSVGREKQRQFTAGIASVALAWWPAYWLAGEVSNRWLHQPLPELPWYAFSVGTYAAALVISIDLFRPQSPSARVRVWRTANA